MCITVFAGMDIGTKVILVQLHTCPEGMDRESEMLHSSVCLKMSSALVELLSKPLVLWRPRAAAAQEKQQLSFVSSKHIEIMCLLVTNKLPQRER